MLIHVDASGVADVLSGGATSARSHAAVENLLLAHFEGNHVVSLAPRDAAALRSASPAWSARARRALDHIDENYPQIAGLRADLPWSVELGLGAIHHGKASETPDGRRLIRASLWAFEKSHTTHRAALLAENATDAAFFRQLGLLRCAERGWDALEVVHERRGGGGSTLAVEYETHADRGYILLAIADADRRHPEGAEGGTYHKLRRKAEGRPDYQRARPLPTRTVEGLVPLAVYREVFSSRHGDLRLRALERLHDLLASAGTEVLQYAHLKSGIRLYQIRNPRTQTQAERTYWERVAADAGRARCPRPPAAPCMKKEECECHVVDSLGADALSDVVAWMQGAAPRERVASLFQLSGSRDLTSLADEVLAWGIALPPIFT